MGDGTSLRKPKLEDEEIPDKNSLQRSPDMMKLQSGPVSTQSHTRNMGKQPASPIHFGAQGSPNPSMDRSLPSDLQSPQVWHSYKGKEPLLLQVAPTEKRPIVDRPCHAVRFKDTESVPIPKQKVHDSHALIKPKDEPYTDDFPPDDLPRYEVPIAVIRPGKSIILMKLTIPSATMKYTLYVAERAQSFTISVQVEVERMSLLGFYSCFLL